MTLGNDPQPLTRRQLREMARAQAPESGVDSESGAETGAGSTEKSGSTEKFESTEKSESAEKFESTEKREPEQTPTPVSTSAFAPRTPANPAGDAGLDRDDRDPEVPDQDSAPTAEGPTVPQRTLTRRELRELMAARQAETGVAPDAQGLPSGFVIDEEIVDDDIPEDALDEDALEDDDALEAAPAPDLLTQEAEIEPGTVAEAADRNAPPAPALSLPPQALHTPLNPPVGHWSIDREVDEHAADQSQPFDQLLSRGVAAGGIPTTTNALILPSIPQQGNSSGSLTSTGEILITGSIDLPRSLGSTGQHPNHFDSSEMDHLMDPLDETGPTAGVAPVSASRAVSTHTSTRGVMTPPTKRVASLPVILAVTAGVLLVGVLALFAAGYLFQIF